MRQLAPKHCTTPLDVVRFFTPKKNAQGCRCWEGWRGVRGHARLSFKGKHYLVGRLVLEKKLGRKLRPGLQALHKCNNPPCIEASHLYEGTHDDNMRDRKSDGGYSTAAKGTAHGCAVLGEHQVKAIRLTLRNAPRGTARRLAEHYGVAPTTIYAIKARTIWKHI